MSTVRYRPAPTTREAPEDVGHIVAFFEGAPDGRERFRWTLRDSLDELLDGQRTGRWCYQHLRKTEKTYLGTAIEINLTREYEIADGLDLDWRIDNAEVDCKFSRDMGGWEIPMEMYRCPDHGTQSADEDHPALLVWLNDDTSEWAAGLLRITDARLRWRQGGPGSSDQVRAYNRDNKRRVAEHAFPEIYWLWGGVQNDLPPNLLRHLPAETRDKILRQGSSGQGRVNDLFRHVQDRLINRQVILTVGQQDDAPKRARDARIHLRSEGIIVLGHEDPHQRIATSLGLPMPRKGSWISTRVAPASDNSVNRGFFLEGRWWTKADPSDAILPSPQFPRQWTELETSTPPN
ncbi:NaeI family type II restriction endonuclease [Mycobacterium vicinigordonae]|uniref:Restriction endonuclease n=1 Tax=Mycobacterium vicinigordonae TaxID=1719132 RepID=A0A7D6ITT7_9MYCO|nr:NaeI family type II restriction endonuclease [Mycobacterium vicinigordonae]QLL08639.1 restriction endonuclease [Mycobacterium vicinigordonae]